MEKIYCFSAPGRTELGGNHTDHQHGRVLAAAVDLQTVARVTPNGTGKIRVQSRGYPDFSVELTDLAAREEERNTSAALVRGVAAAFAQRGAKLEGFDMVVGQSVPPGSGLSSSAAFEVLLGRVMNGLFMQQPLSPLEIARIGQEAENQYFGKPCGLMDQLASSVGGVVSIDFADPRNPEVERLDVNFREEGYGLCILHCGVGHEDLTEEYVAVTRELGAVCSFFGKQYLREVSERDFLAALPELEKRLPHRAILRAFHVFGENRRVEDQVQALKKKDMNRYLELVGESGRSSWMYLQNIDPRGSSNQPMAFALMLCESLLRGAGAWRIHGGGFAGTVQAYVPLDQLPQFRQGAEAVLGQGSCTVLKIE